MTRRRSPSSPFYPSTALRSSLPYIKLRIDSLAQVALLRGEPVAEAARDLGSTVSILVLPRSCGTARRCFVPSPGAKELTPLHALYIHPSGLSESRLSLGQIQTLVFSAPKTDIPPADPKHFLAQNPRALPLPGQTSPSPHLHSPHPVSFHDNSPIRVHLNNILNLVKARRVVHFFSCSTSRPSSHSTAPESQIFEYIWNRLAEVIYTNAKADPP